MDDPAIELLRRFLEPFGHRLGLSLVHHHQFEIYHAALVVGELEAHRIGPVWPLLDGGLYLPPAEELTVPLLQVFVTALADRVGEAGLTGGAVPPSLVRKSVEAGGGEGQVPGADQVGQAIGKVEVVNGVVAEGQVQDGVKGRRLLDSGGDVENQKFNFQFVLDKARHSGGLLSGFLARSVVFFIIPRRREKDKSA